MKTIIPFWVTAVCLIGARCRAAEASTSAPPAAAQFAELAAKAEVDQRAAVWLDEDNLICLPAGKGPTKLNLRTGEEERLPPSGLWLPNQTMTCVTTGEPTFSPYDAGSGKISEQAALGGCMPYFTTDGVWGFWMGGGGGPINRIRLGTRQVSPIITLHDSRLPADRGYLYFPMFSRCQRLFAFGASPDQHDHATSDYDIFVAPANPETLELTGNPVRYTFHKATDRYPDVFLADFELGTHVGEAPFTLDLTGVRDLAQRPNPVPATKIVVRPTEWPTDRNGLVFAWRTAAVAVSTVDPATGKPGVIKVARRNAARLDRNYALLLDGGSSVAADADARLLEACRASNALTIEATLTPANVTQEGPARIVTFSSDPLSRNFTLGQTRDKLILRLRTPQTGVNGVNPEVELCSVQASRAYHVTVTYSGGHLSCYVDGAKVLDSSAVQGDFSNWRPLRRILN